MKEKGVILIEKATRERLKDLGAKRETYDDIINRLIDEYIKGEHTL